MKRDGRLSGLIRPGDTLPLCPRGHTTCWPDRCPVCRSQELDRRINDRKAIGKRAWETYLAREAARKAMERVRKPA